MSENSQKIQTGIVVSDKMTKTVIVAVERRVMDKDFKKYVRRITKFKVHDEKNECKMGDHVEIVETKPISKEKRWRVIKIVHKSDVLELVGDPAS